MSVVARIGPVRQRLARRAVPSGPVALVVDVRAASPMPPTVTSSWEQAPGVRPGGPDTVVLSVEGGEPPAELDGRYLSVQVVGGFTGRVIGMYVTGMYVTEGSVSFDWFASLPSGS